MLKKIGRLDPDTIAEIEDIVKDVFEKLDNKQTQEAEDVLFEAAKTPNYFIREYMGKKLATYNDLRKIRHLINRMLEHRVYGIRATGLFFYFNRFAKEPEKIIEVLDSAYSTVPWESETIVNYLWKKYPSIMKEHMLAWTESDDEKKRALAFHGMENISSDDPIYIMDFISKLLDDKSLEVQKKITHILTQVARSRPAECYPYIREWLMDADEKRRKTLWVSMKKLVNIVSQRSRREKSQEFVLLTKQTIADWKSDKNKKVSQMGSKLFGIIHRK